MDNKTDLIDLRCPICNKKLALVSAADVGIKYLQLKCCRCKTESFYSGGKMMIKQIK